MSAVSGVTADHRAPPSGRVAILFCQATPRPAPAGDGSASGRGSAARRAPRTARPDARRRQTAADSGEAPRPPWDLHPDPQHQVLTKNRPDPEAGSLRPAIRKPTTHPGRADLAQQHRQGGLHHHETGGTTLLRQRAPPAAVRPASPPPRWRRGDQPPPDRAGRWAAPPVGQARRGLLPVRQLGADRAVGIVVGSPNWARCHNV